MEIKPFFLCLPLCIYFSMALSLSLYLFIRSVWILNLPSNMTSQKLFSVSSVCYVSSVFRYVLFWKNVKTFISGVRQPEYLPLKFVLYNFVFLQIWDVKSVGNFFLFLIVRQRWNKNIYPQYNFYDFCFILLDMNEN